MRIALELKDLSAALGKLDRVADQRLRQIIVNQPPAAKPDQRKKT